MNLDDSFADKILQRSKARRELLAERKKDVLPVISKKRSALDEQQTNSEQPPEESPKRQCIEMQQSVYSPHDKENVNIQSAVLNDAFIPFHPVSKVKGLAALKKSSNGDDVSKFTETSEPQVNTCQTYIFSTNTHDICSGTKSRFKNLAADIRQWEDDTHKPTLSSKNVTSSNTSNLSHLSNTPNSSKSNTISMKLYYTNKPANVALSETHAASVSKHTSFPVFGEGNFSTDSCNEGNIDDGSGAGRKGRIEAWDKAIAATLTTPTSVRSPLKPVPEVKNQMKPALETEVYNDLDESEYSDDESIDEDDFAENYDEISSESKNDCKMEFGYSPVKSFKDHGNIKSQTAVKISTPVTEEPVKEDVDPVELPLAARRALFEKALLGGSTKNKIDVVEQNLSVAQRAALFENASRPRSLTKQTSLIKEPKCIAFSKVSNNQPLKSPVKSVQSATSSAFSPVKDSLKKTTSVPVSPTQSPSKNIGSHTRTIQQKLIQNSSGWQDKEMITKASEERKQEISNLVNHWEKISSSSSAEIDNSESTPLSVRSPLKPVSEVKNEIKPLLGTEAYSNLDENEYSDNDEEEDESEYSDEESINEDVFGENYNESSSENKNNCKMDLGCSPTKSFKDHGNTKSQTENYSNEQVFHNEDHHSQSSSTQDCRNAASSMSYSDISSLSDDTNYSATKIQSDTSDSSARSSETTASEAGETISIGSKENKSIDVPLVYTVSFYRKQKQEARLTPVRTIVRREKVSSPESPEDEDYTQVIQNRIKDLQEEILRQQTVISQTSQALNHCSATAEFSGSTEQVEGERLLLIATQKRQACLNEIQRLKSCGSKGENVSDGTGTLLITDIQLPLKREFMASVLQGKGNDTVHYFLCLIRHGPQVIVTQMMSTSDKVTDGALAFTNHIKLQNLTAEFSVVFEVYALQTKKEVLPHEKKYHIKRENSKLRLTPKVKKSDGKILMPAISSPGGPNAVRSPSFGVIGYTRFTLQNCNKRVFTLDKVPFTSPLDGVLRIKLQLHAEHKVVEKGFLTMFEDVSGFGAWHRRWCMLDAHQLVFWKYPDDEQKKEPLGFINLKQCVTGQVKLVSRDICARPHTFQLVTIRPQEKGDKNTLISRSINTLTTTKHLLSADTKEERILWCNKLNEALTNVRKWDPQAIRPVEPMQETLQF